MNQSLDPGLSGRWNITCLSILGALSFFIGWCEICFVVPVGRGHDMRRRDGSAIFRTYRGEKQRGVRW